MNALTKYKGMFSKIFDKVIEGDYFSIGKNELERLHYDDISAPANNHIFLMKQWDEQAETILNDGLTSDQIFYRNNGYLIKEKFIPEHLIDQYMYLRKKMDLGDKGFGSPVSYIKHPEIRDIALYPPLVQLLRDLHAADMALFISHTTQRSTQRGWHQDSYLDNKAATVRLGVWFAMDDIHPDSGPFEYVPVSHRWQPLCNQKINSFLKENYQWPRAHNDVKQGDHPWGAIAEAFINPAVLKKIDQEDCKIKAFHPEKGDVMIWYGHLMHRGAPPKQANMTRASIIAQYVAVNEKGRGLFARCRKSGGYFLVRPSMYKELKFNDD